MNNSSSIYKGKKRIKKPKINILEYQLIKIKMVDNKGYYNESLDKLKELNPEVGTLEIFSESIRRMTETLNQRECQCFHCKK